MTELGIFSVMWSEHCSYKSSRVWLRALPTTGARVIQGPGRERGRRRPRRRGRGHLQDGEPQPPVLHRALPGRGHGRRRHHARRVHDGRAACREPQRAALRRSIARRRRATSSPASSPGIGGYGNCVGVPTVGGEVELRPRLQQQHPRQRHVRRPRQDATRSSTRAAKGRRPPVVYVGSKTGRDGIHGATMASAEFDEKSDEKRPTVQVGDPFTEKLLIEACLELMASGRHHRHPGHGRCRPHLARPPRWPTSGGVGIELILDHRAAARRRHDAPTR